VISETLTMSDSDSETISLAQVRARLSGSSTVVAASTNPPKDEGEIGGVKRKKDPNAPIEVDDGDEDVDEAAVSASATKKLKGKRTAEVHTSAAAAAALLDSTANPAVVTWSTLVQGADHSSIATARDCASVPFAALAVVFEQIEQTTKRLIITQLLTTLFRSLIVHCPADILPAVYMCVNAIAPAYENVETGVGESLLVKALAEATGRQVSCFALHWSSPTILVCTLFGAMQCTERTESPSVEGSLHVC
jgi:hypothetical protein